MHQLNEDIRDKELRLIGSGGEMTMQTVAVTGTLNNGTAISGGVTYTYSGSGWSY